MELSSRSKGGLLARTSFLVPVLLHYLALSFKESSLRLSRCVVMDLQSMSVEDVCEFLKTKNYPESLVQIFRGRYFGDCDPYSILAIEC